MSNTEEELRRVFNNDEFLLAFLSVEEEKLLKPALSVNEKLNKLAEGISLIDQEIQRQVLKNHEDLLSQATWIEKLEGALNMMSQHVLTLLVGVEKVISQIKDPYEKLRKQILILRNVWKTLDLLTGVSRVVNVSKRLRDQIEKDPNELLKLSEIIRELGELMNEMDFSNIEIIEPDFKLLKAARRDVGKKAKNHLILGLQNDKSEQVLYSLEVLFNLNSLTDVVNEFRKTTEESLENLIRENLDVGFLMGNPSGKNTAPGSGSNFRPKLWSTLEKLFDDIFGQCVIMEALEIALKKPRIRSNLLIETLPDKHQNLTKNFWTSITDYLALQLNNTAEKSLFVKQALEGEYPRFLRLYIDLVKRLENTEKPEGFETPFAINKNVLSAFEKPYLSKSVNMVLDPVHNMFSKESIPSFEDIDLLIRTIRSELSVALFDPNLSCTIARNITKAVRLFCMNCDNIVDRSSDATQVIGPRKTAQDKNIEIANLAEYLKSKLTGVVSNLNITEKATVTINLSLIDVDKLINNIISLVMTAIEAAIRAILLTMKQEDFSKEVVKGEVSPSLYMRELHEFISRSCTTYLKPFESEDLLRKCAQSTGQRCVTLFMRYVALLRPLGSGGKARLVMDCNQLESAVALLIGEDPKTIRLIRSFRSIITQTPEEILANPVVGDIIPISLVLFFLFSAAPEELKSPHESGLNWSVEELSSWLDSHESERDRLELINGALNRYCNIIRRQKPAQNFHPVYAVMAELIQRSAKE